MNSKVAYSLGLMISLIYIPIRCIISLIKSIVSLCRNDDYYQHNAIYPVFFVAACMVGVFSHHFQAPMLMVIWPLMTLLLSLCLTLSQKSIDDYTSPLEVLILLKEPGSTTEIPKHLMSHSLTKKLETASKNTPTTAKSLLSTNSPNAQNKINTKASSCSTNQFNSCSTLVSLFT